jgi:hypothetical protein
MDRNCGPGVAALAPRSGDNQTSGERVENDALDPELTIKADKRHRGR